MRIERVGQGGWHLSTWGMGGVVMLKKRALETEIEGR